MLLFKITNNSSCELDEPRTIAGIHRQRQRVQKILSRYQKASIQQHLEYLEHCYHYSAVVRGRYLESRSLQNICTVTDIFPENTSTRNCIIKFDNMYNETLNDENRNRIHNLLDQLYQLKLESCHDANAADIVPTIVLTDDSSNGVASIKTAVRLAHRRSVDGSVQWNNNNGQIESKAGNLFNSCTASNRSDTQFKNDISLNTCSLQVPKIGFKRGSKLSPQTRVNFCSESQPLLNCVSDIKPETHNKFK
uniref:Uncharacterized protein n=1 Tax=Anopheles atroparvus TaxID=41427 RepID=A0AAG5D4C8_ANOAO